jgi:DNA helicase HerA-like ATPase
MRTDDAGRGMINILSAETLMTSPKLYAAFMLWLVSELFEELPEAGDTDKPKLVFFFDEAHLLFRDAEPGLIEKVEQVVRLIRSKGVGLYFITQNPQDVPDRVLSQLGNRIQHALRAYTPSEQRAVRVAADSFRPNPAFDTQDIITQLGVGEALVSTLEKKGVPSVVEKTLIRPPQCRMGPITPTERQAILTASPLGGIYDETLDRHSAYEILQQRMAEAEDFANEDTRDFEDERRFEAERGRRNGGGGGVRYGSGGGNRRVSGSSSSQRRRSSRSDSISEAAVKSFARSMSSTMGRELSKSIARGIFGSTRRRRTSTKRRRR